MPIEQWFWEPFVLGLPGTLCVRVGDGGRPFQVGSVAPVRTWFPDVSWDMGLCGSACQSEVSGQSVSRHARDAPCSR